MSKQIVFPGLDVHAKSIALGVAPGDGGEARLHGAIARDLHALEEVFAKLRKAHPKAALRVCREAGSTGFHSVAASRLPHRCGALAALQSVSRPAFGIRLCGVSRSSSPTALPAQPPAFLFPSASSVSEAFILKAGLRFHHEGHEEHEDRDLRMKESARGRRFLHRRLPVAAACI